MNETIQLKISELADLAVEGWRLERWAFMRGFEKDRVVARRTARALDFLLKEAGFELCDLAGQVYDPGLAIEVVDTEGDVEALPGSARIVETIAPIVFWRGQLVKTGQVAIA